jgi:hypothetical protein
MSDFYELMKAGSLTKQLACIQAAVRWEENKMDEYAAIEPWDYQAFGGGMYNPITLSDGTTIKVPSGAIIMTAAYYDRWAQIDNDQWKILATESGFGLNREVKLGETDEVVVYYTGRPDLVAMESHTGLVVVCDHKTSSAVEGRFLQRFKPHDQFPGYIFAVRELLKDIGLRDRQAGRFLVNGAARKKPPETSKAKVKPEWFRRFEIPYVESELEEWRQATLHRVEDIQMAIKTDYFEGRTASCHSPGECNFVRVCSQPPEKRLIILKSEFLVKEPWKPYKKEEKCQTTGSNQYSQQAV